MIDYSRGTLVSLIILSWNIVFSYSENWHENFTIIHNTCTNEECFQYIKYVTQNMNRNADPCNDFYEFVCGKKKNPLVQYYPAWSTTIEMSIKSAARIRKILEEPSKQHDSPELRKAKKLHEACMEMPHLAIFNPSDVNTYVRESEFFPLLSDGSRGSLERKPWTNIHKYYFSLTGDSGLYEIHSIGDSHTDFKPLLFLTGVHSPFGRITFNTALKGARKKLYAKYLKAVLFSVFSYNLLKVSSKILDERIEAVVAFRCEIYAFKALASSIMLPPHNYNVMTVGELENWYKAMSAGKPAAMIRWLELIQSLYGKNGTKRVSTDTKINVINKSYHQSMVNLIDKTPKDVIVNHMHLYFMEKHLEHNAILQEMLMSIVLFDKVKVTATVIYPGKKWHVCVLSNTMNEAIGKAYVKHHFPTSKKQEIQKYVAEMKEVLTSQIQGAKWLNSNIMNKFTNVVSDMNVIIGYPEYYDNDFLRHGYNPTVEPGNIEAFYCPNNNRLIISAAIFQLPLYHSQLPKTILYGSMGTLIGHELYHAFSPQAMEQCYTFTIPGTKKYLYEERTKCFLRKYNKIPIRELKHITPVPTIDGSRTLNENLPDAMGLKLAYETFRRDGWMHGTCSILPIYRGINCEQLFFIAFATMFCADIEQDVLLEEVFTEEHATPRVRVNEAVSNMKEFIRAFDCPKKAILNTEKKCDLWK